MISACSRKRSKIAVAAGELFGAAAETLKLFQKNNWRVDGGFLSVLHTWGRALNWHPHLHVLVSAGGRDCTSGKWRQARSSYLFPVKALSRHFRGRMVGLLRRAATRGELVRVTRPGGTVVLVERFDPHTTLSVLAEHGVTVVSGVPTMWTAWAELRDALRLGVLHPQLPDALENRVFDAPGLRGGRHGAQHAERRCHGQ